MVEDADKIHKLIEQSAKFTGVFESLVDESDVYIFSFPVCVCFIEDIMITETTIKNKVDIHKMTGYDSEFLNRFKREVNINGRIYITYSRA